MIHRIFVNQSPKNWPGLALAGLLTVLAFAQPLAQGPDPFSPHVTDPKLRALNSLPTGLRVTHAPNPVRAGVGGRSGRRYTWLYATTVESLGGTVTVEEFGAFVLQGGEWRFATFTGKPFTPQNFAAWYSCPGAEVKPDKPCTDPQNWSGSNQLRHGRALWYFVGRDANGRRVKGYAIIDELAEIAA